MFGLFIMLGQVWIYWGLSSPVGLQHRRYRPSKVRATWYWLFIDQKNCLSIIFNLFEKLDEGWVLLLDGNFEKLRKFVPNYCLKIHHFIPLDVNIHLD